MNLYGYAKGDPVNFGDAFGLLPDSTFRSVPRATRQNQQPEASLFGKPALQRYEKLREIHYGGMVLSARRGIPAVSYQWDVSIEGESEGECAEIGVESAVR